MLCFIIIYSLFIIFMLQEKTIHLLDKKFNSNEYSDNDERDRESSANKVSVSDTFDKS